MAGNERGSGAPIATTPSIAVTSGSTASSSSVPHELQGSAVVHFRSADGVDLEGRMFGTGAIGVVLAHIADPQEAQAEWFSFAPVLVHHGYRVLTFDFRGFCPGDLAGCSGTGDRAKIWLDVVAACDFLRSKGVGEVFAVGAGLGGHAALFAASRPGVDLAGVVELGAPQRALLGPMSYDITLGGRDHRGVVGDRSPREFALRYDTRGVQMRRATSVPVGIMVSAAAATTAFASAATILHASW